MLEKNGYSIHKNFLNNQNTLDLLNSIEKIFGGVSAIPNGYEVKKFSKNNYKKYINYPCVAINHYNLLEMAVNIFELLKLENKFIFENKKNYRLTNIDIEKVLYKNISIHTDNNKGMFRCFLFLKGGTKKTGCLRYIKESNNRDYDVKHHLRDYFIENNTSDEERKNKLSKLEYLEVNPGDLVLMDTYGFHGNNSQLSPRVAIIFEFRINNNLNSSNDIVLNSQLLSKKVLDNLFLIDTKAKGKHASFIRNNYINNQIKPTQLFKPIFKYFLKSLI